MVKVFAVTFDSPYIATAGLKAVDSLFLRKEQADMKREYLYSLGGSPHWKVIEMEVQE